MLCQKILIIDQGKIIAQDSAATLSARIKGVLIFEMLIKGTTEDVQKTLKKVKGVLKIKTTGEGETRRYQVECEKGQDIRDELASAIVSNGYSLLELKSTEMSLEDIFLKLTTKERE